MSTTPKTGAKRSSSDGQEPQGVAHLRGETAGGGTLKGNLTASQNIRSVGELGDFVLSRRKARKLSQQEFADLAGVGRRFVSELESGKPTAEIGKVLQVLQALGIDMIVKDR